MTLPNDLRSIAEAIDTLYPAATTRIRSLAAAVEPEADADGWENINILEVIDPAEIEARLRRSGSQLPIITWLEFARNALVLLPVLVTWFAIDIAASGYSAALAAEPDLAGQPFIHLWQQGFYGHSQNLMGIQMGWLTLSTTALIDFILVFVLVAISVFIHWLTNTHRNSTGQLATEISAQLRLHLWRAQMELNKRTTPEGQNNRLFTLAGQLLDEISAERERLRDVAAERDMTVSNLTNFIEVFQRSMSELLLGAQELKAVSAGLLERASVLSNGRVSETESTTQVQLADSAELLARSAVESTQIVARVSNAVDLLNAELRGIRADLSGERANYAKAAEAAARSSKALDSVLGTLGASANSIQNGTQNFAHLAQAVNELTSVSRDLQVQVRLMIENAPTADAIATVIRQAGPSRNAETARSEPPGRWWRR